MTILTDANATLTAQVAEYAIHLKLKGTNISALTKKITNLQIKVENL